MKEVILMSIQPKWLVKILNGEKTIEIRKTMPKCELPIDVYLYCTINGKPLLRLPTIDKKEWFLEAPYGWVVDKKHGFNGKVVAKFTLKRFSTCLNTDYGNEEILKNACLTKQELDDYVGKRKFFAWHIKQLEIFDEPKELNHFYKTVAGLDELGRFILTDEGVTIPQLRERYLLKKPPMSWQYVWDKE